MTKCNGKNINALNCSTSNCIYLIICRRCGLQYVGVTLQSLRDRMSDHRKGMKNYFLIINVRCFANILVLVFVEMSFT